MSLSGGQQQRLCIARAIAVEPDVILMDEPCSALDPIATARIEDLMHELVADYTIVIVTHNMQQAARVSDRTAFFTVDVTDDGHAHRDGRGVRPDRDDLHEPVRSTDRGLRHGAGSDEPGARFHEELERIELELLSLGSWRSAPSRVGRRAWFVATTPWRSSDRRRRRDRRPVPRHRAPGPRAAGAPDPGGGRSPADLRHHAHQPASRAHRRPGREHREALLATRTLP